MQIFLFVIFQEQMLHELEKNIDKSFDLSSPDNGPLPHLYELLASLQKHLLAYCHVNDAMVSLLSWILPRKCMSKSLD